MEALMPIGHQGSMGGEGKTPAQPESQPQKSNFTAFIPQAQLAASGSRLG
jgi:hypothetical protein